MRRLLLALVVTASAGTAAAQTDADLLDRIVAATQPAAAGILPFGQLAADLTPAARQAVADSTRARFQADWQPDRVREALVALDRPALQRVTARMAQRPTADEVAALAFGTGKSASAADSALAGPYLRATGRTQATIALVERALRAAVDTFPEARADLERRGQTLDEAIADSRRDIAETLLPIDLATARLQLAGLAPADVEVATAFEFTPAGRYVRATVDEATARALLPEILNLIRSVVHTTAFDGTARDGAPLDGIGKPTPRPR